VARFPPIGTNPQYSAFGTNTGRFDFFPFDFDSDGFGTKFQDVGNLPNGQQ
jgi:hypothetical protein